MPEFLIISGISVKDKAFDGSTAADLARRHGHDRILQLLEPIKEELLSAQSNLEDPYQQQTQHDLFLTGIFLSAAHLMHQG